MVVKSHFIGPDFFGDPLKNMSKNSCYLKYVFHLDAAEPLGGDGGDLPTVSLLNQFLHARERQKSIPMNSILILSLLF